VLADFDNDGRKDIFSANSHVNDRVAETSSDRYRLANTVFRNLDGTRFEDVTAASPALAGDVHAHRGCAVADFDGDGRLDLAVSQNGAATRLFHNRGARPGLRVRLIGAAANPDAVGAQIRVVYRDRMGPVREVEAGSGYWSENGAVQVLGLSGTPTAVWVRWPGGAETRVPVPAGAREVVVRR
jgi:hypothetical protein